MSHRKFARPPLEKPVIASDQKTDHDWEKWFNLVSDTVTRVVKYDVVFDPASVSANTTSEQTVTVNGVASNDFVIVSKPTNTAGLGIVNCRVSAQNTVAITFMNATGGAINAGSETYTFLVFKV